jgi:hypothetical protein
MASARSASQTSRFSLSLSLSLKGTENLICVCADPFLSMAYKVLQENPS